MGKGTSVLGGLWQRWRGRRIASADSLAAFLDREAAQIAQRSVIGYCHVKTRLPLSELMIEKRFADAFERSRWEAYAAVLADLIQVVEGYLRPAAAGRTGALAERLADLYAAILSRHPEPSVRAAGWGEDVERLRARLAAAQLAPPLAVARIAESSAERLYETLPIHEQLRQPDKPAILANVQFLIVGLAHRFEKGIDHDALVADLLAVKGAAA